MQIRLLLHIIDICYILDVFNKNLVRLNSFSSDVILGLCARYVALSLSPSTKRKQLKVPHGTSGKRGKSLRRSYRKKRRGKAAGGEGDGTKFMGAHFSGWKRCWDAGKTEKRCRHQLSQKKRQSVTAFDFEIESTCPLEDLDFPSVCGMEHMY